MPEVPVVQLLSVTKVFTDLWGRPRVAAVDGLSIEVERGEVLGILGPNGAGKSTTIKLLLGLLHPTRGRIAVFGRDPRDLEVRRRTGYLPEETRLHKFLTARETLDFFGQLLGLERGERRRRTGALLEMVGLSGASDRTVGEMSKGMARRIGLAVALVGDPELLVLDEPTSGLDPLGTREVKDLVQELGRRGKTILLSSHLLADVEDACRRIAILYGGKVRALGPTQDLLARDERLRIELDRPGDASQVQALEAAVRGVVGDAPVSIGAPHDRLEAFFLRVVGAARAAREETAGAREGGEVAPFLRGGPVPAPVPVPVPAPVPVPVPAPAPVSAPVPVSVPAPAPVPERSLLESVVPPPREEPRPSADSAKTRAVLERLLRPAERGPKESA
jgi:ABC-2 type transport system ATP-binding protein